MVKIYNPYKKQYAVFKRKMASQAKPKRKSKIITDESQVIKRAYGANRVKANQLVWKSPSWDDNSTTKGKVGIGKMFIDLHSMSYFEGSCTYTGEGVHYSCKDAKSDFTSVMDVVWRIVVEDTEKDCSWMRQFLHNKQPAKLDKAYMEDMDRVVRKVMKKMEDYRPLGIRANNPPIATCAAIGARIRMYKAQLKEALGDDYLVNRAEVNWETVRTKGQRSILSCFGK